MKIHLIIYFFIFYLSSLFSAPAFTNVTANNQQDILPVPEIIIVGRQAVTPDLISMDPYFYFTDQDEPHFSKPLADKRAWTKKSFGGLPLKDKNLWVQVDFTLGQQTAKSLGILIMMVASFDVYWDGKLLGSNGIVGNSRESEQAGQIEFGLQLNKEQISEGKHTLSLKVSTHHNNSQNAIGSFYIFSGYYPQIIQHSSKSAMLPLAMSGALLLLATYCLFLYFGVIKNVCYLLFSGLCFATLVLFVLESWRGIWGYTYDWHIPRLQLIYLMTSLISILLTSFFTFFFTLSNFQRYATLTVNVLLQLSIFVIVSGYDFPSLLLILVGLVTSLFPCVYAIRQKQKNARPMLVAIMFFIMPLTMNVRLYMEQYFFISFVTLMGVMLYSLSQTMKMKQRQLMQSQINASRLELELVKRNLQPHFILNTLTAVEEWIEESPAMAVKFIDALADEFRLMAKISSLSLVPIKDEIEMCNTHLNLMQYRSNTKFQLRTNSLPYAYLLPPGILLTLLENALSHNCYQSTSVVFTLDQAIDNKLCTLVFTAPVNVRQTENKAISVGLGTKYIEARLQESFVDHWSFSTEQNSTYLQVTLQFPLICQKVV